MADWFEEATWPLQVQAKDPLASEVLVGNRASWAVFGMFGTRSSYRYALGRAWDANVLPLVVIGLNPSTATHELDDPTIRKCKHYAKAWGYGGLVMLNIYAYRSTDPKVLKALAAEAAGPYNNSTIRWFCRPERAGAVLAAWGAHGALYGRGVQVARMLAAKAIPLLCLGTTKGNQPLHPLYQKNDTHPIPYTWAGLW